METSSSAAHQGVGVGVGATFLLENACLDLFLLDLDAPPQQLRGLLAAAWDQDALTALRLVCHRRGVPRQAGESVAQREGFLTAALWMLQTHPRTLADNVAAFADFAYIHDFPELLHRLVVAHAAAQVRPGRKRARDADAVADPAATSSSVPLDPAATSSSVPLAVADPAATLPLAVADPAATLPLSVADPAATLPLAVADPAATSSPSAPLAVAATSSAAATTHPFGYEILYNAIVDFFVGQLRSDLDNLLRNGMISLAAKWCSSMDSALDQTRLLQKDIVRRLLPNDCIGDTDHHLLGLLRRNVVVPLTKALEKQPQPQSSSSSSQSRARLPHQIVNNFAKENWVKKSDTARNRATEEWRSMVEGLRSRACLGNCIAVCDMSRGSDDLSRLEVCVALGMLISELSDHPWSNWVHVFSSNTASTIPISRFATYTDKAAAIWEKQCEDRFNLTRVFQWVLLVALEEKALPKDMVKNIIVLTGRDLDQASVAPSQLLVRPEDMKPNAFDPTDQRRWRDEYRIIKDMFHEHGFAEHVPGVVFWNLRGEPRSAALTWAKDGVLSLSGYSDDLMRLFLDKSGVVEPDDEMYAAISAEEYQKLKTD